MLAGLDAEMAGLAEVILVGDSDMIRQIAVQQGFDISRMEVIHAIPTERGCLAGDEDWCTMDRLTLP